MKKILTLLAVALCAVLSSFYFDNASSQVFHSLRLKTLLFEPSVIFFTALGIFGIAGLIILFLVLKKRYEILILAIISLCSGLVFGYVLKLIFQVPRPEFDVRGLILARGYSFPSMHAIGAIAVLPFIPMVTKNNFLRIVLAIVFILVPLSRLYLGVHRLSDVVFGSVVGLFVGLYIIALEKEYKFTRIVVKKIKEDLEVRRQILHFAVGFLIAGMVFYNFLDWKIFTAILAFGIGFSLFLKYVKIPIFHAFHCMFDRECDIKKFPGRGLIFMFAGSFAAYMLFPKNIAIASILTLAIGDSLTNIFGKYCGKIVSPFDKSKNIEGTIIAFFITALGIIKFVSFQQAIVATLLAMLIEMVPIRVWKIKIDDNLLIPIVAGTIMSLL
ncbi:MAG: phosphatidate cytidylyltransferase [Candidatus Peregrinibacteria bacterium GW2011_GWF2_38_29]|nr:MAG: phosphatidate cytidylyltransferase [Candidatus Peregrinibacteria bacterium GW2011_GWF2_38_29]HBB03052.1 hypothetical protein [Candidatus Peregrinibacteria bacterium]